MSLIFQKRPFNYEYKVGIANLVDVESGPVTVTGAPTGVDRPLHRLVLPRNTLVMSGQKATLVTAGVRSGGGTIPTVNLDIGATRVMADALTFSGLNGILYRFEMFRQLNDLIVVIMGLQDTPLALNLSTIGVGAARQRLVGFDFSIDQAIQFSVTLTAIAESITQEATHLSVE